MPVQIPTTTIGATLKGMTGMFQFQYPAQLPKYYLNMVVTKYHKLNPTAVADLIPTANFCIPLPTQLQDSHSVSYTEEDLGIAGGAISHGISNIPNTSQALGNAVADGVPSAIKALG